MSTIAEKVSDAVNDVTATLANTSISKETPAAGNDKSTNAAHNDAVLASAAEGRRLYIGNLAYATTEEELTAFFKGYLMYVLFFPSLFSIYLFSFSNCGSCNRGNLFRDFTF